MTQSNKKVLFILPHYNFRDKEYLWVKERLDEASIYSEVASTHLSDAEGLFGALVRPDELITSVSAADYDAYVFVGEEAAQEFYKNTTLERLIIDAVSLRKVVGAIGFAVPIVGYSNVLTDHRITGHSSSQKLLEQMGAFFSGSLTEVDGKIVTASGPFAVREFGDIIVSLLNANGKKLNGREYLR